MCLCFLVRKNIVQAKAWFDKWYSAKAASRQIVGKCFINLKRKNKFVAANSKVMLQERVYTLMISRERVDFILH